MKAEVLLGGSFRVDRASRLRSFALAAVLGGLIGFWGLTASIAADAPAETATLPVLPSIVAPDVVIEAPRISDTSAVVSLDDPDLQTDHPDDYTLFTRALAKVKAFQAGKLTIPGRVYTIKAPAAISHTGPILQFSDLTDLVIEGNQAQLVFADIDYRAGLQLAHDQRVLIKDLSIDWQPILAFPGTVSWSLDPATHLPAQILTVDATYPIDDNAPPILSFLFQFDRQNGHYHWSNRPSVDKMVCPDVTLHCPRYIGDHKFVLPFERQLLALPANADVVATRRSNNFAAVLITAGSSDITLDGITVYSSPGGGIMAIESGRGLQLRHCTISRKPNALLADGELPRLISTTADALNVIAAEGDFVLEDSEISYAADDGLNIRGSLRTISRMYAAADIIHVQAGTDLEYHAGDAVEIVESDTFLPIARAKIDDAAVSNGDWTLHLDAPVATLSDGRPLLLSLDRKRSATFVVRRNYFHDLKNRGVILRGGPGVVDSNRFEHTTSSAIQLAAERWGSYAEGPAAHNVIVSNNHVDNSNRGDYLHQDGNQKMLAAIAVYTAIDSKYGSAGANHDIAILNNDIDHVPALGVFLSSAKNIEIAGNRFLHLNQSNVSIKSLPRAIMSIRNTDHIWMHNNITDYRGPTPVDIDPKSTSDIVIDLK